MPFKVHDSFGQKRAWATSKMQFGLCKAQELGFFFVWKTWNGQANCVCKYNKTGKQETFFSTWKSMPSATTWLTWFDIFHSSDNNTS